MTPEELAKKNAMPKDMNAPLSRTNALPGQNYHPEELYSLNKEQMGRGDQFFTDKQNYGVGNTPLLGDQNTDPMVQALQGNYATEFGNNVEALKTRNAAESPLMASNQRTDAAKQIGTQAQNEEQNFSAQYSYQLKRQAMLNQYKLAQQRAEAAIYRDLFSGLATVGGYALGSGGGSGGGAGEGKSGGGSNNVGTQNGGGWDM